MKFFRHTAALLAAALLTVSSAYADVKISNLPPGTTLGGTEPVPAVQGGVTVRTTPAAISTYTKAQFTSADVRGLWTGTCDATTFLRGDGACAFVPVTGANVRALWTGTCDATSFLRGDGACALVSLTTNVTGQLSLTTGVSGLLPVTNGGTGQGSLATDNLFMGAGTGAMVAKSLSSCSAANSALTYNTTTHLWGCNTISAGSGTVTSVDLTVPSGFSVTGNPVTTSGTLAISGTLNPAAGGTGVATLANDSLLMGNGTAAMSAKAIPSCSAASSALTYNTTTDTWGCNTISGGGSVAGSDTQIQFNNAGAFGASSKLTWTDSTTVLSLGTSGQQVTIQALPTGGASASQLNILGGNASGGGGALQIQGGSSTSGATGGGNVAIQGGTQLGAGPGGNVTLQGGLTVDGNGGNVTVLARNGAGTNRDGGNVTFNTGAATGSGAPGRINLAGPALSTGTKFTASGCSNSATVGGVQAGQYTSGTTGTCTVVITLPTALNGWVCHATDVTTGVVQPQTASTTTSCTVSGATTSTNVVNFMALGY